ncbi:hypothetical protein B4N84_06290 [Flavobacterium sp. IR1]|nr:hypothetical protein B4N84_06290 [Flavobacterium sp. IR1]
MIKSEINPMPEYFDRYINLVEDIELEAAFDTSIEQLQVLDILTFEKLKGKTYQEGKWTVNEIIQHITDIERLLCSGVLRFAREDSDFVIGFDEDELARKSKANLKPVKEIIEELIVVRKATIALYKSFDREDMMKTGINWKHRISVLAMGFNIIGHQIHHLKFIEERYLPLIESSNLEDNFKLKDTVGN